MKKKVLISSSIFLLFICQLSTIKANSDSLVYQFNFGKTEIPGIVNITMPEIYDSTRGYGFDYNTVATIVERKTGEPTQKGFATSNAPFYFSVKLPEGYYNVTVGLGDKEGESLTTVKAESRRLMLEKIKTAEKEIKTCTFTVNVRTPKINDTLSIRLKPREHKYLNWDNKLTLEFTDQKPCVCYIQIEKIKPEKTIFLAGNSTVTDQNEEPWASWGQMITKFFEPGIAVANFAESGESLHSFYHSYRLEKVLSLIQPGDYLFIEFAHNDQKRKGPGIGPWESYSDYLRLYIDKIRQKGAIPVLITSMHRRNFDPAGHAINTLGDYPDAMRAVAKEKNVALIDLNNMSKILYEAWGPEASKKAFCQYPANTFPNQKEELKDNTHFNNYGAYHIALCILNGIREKIPDLNKYIVHFQGFDPTSPIPFPKWDLPFSPLATNQKPDGS